MSHDGEGRIFRVTVLVVGMTLAAMACGSGDASNGGAGSTVASTGRGQGAAAGAGTVAFQLGSGCNRAVSDGRDFLAVGCPGSISRIDPSNGKPRWSVDDPTWTEVQRLSLSGDVVTALVKVSVPASGLTARSEGNRVVALAGGKKVWETKLNPVSDTRANGTADVVVVSYSGERPTGAPRAGTVTAYDPQTGRVRFERSVDGAKCSLEGPMILKSSVIACGQRFALIDGSALPLAGSARILAAEPTADIAVGYESDVSFKILRSDGSQASVAKGEFAGFTADTIVAKDADSNGRGGKLMGISHDGAPRWEQAVTFDAPRGFFDNVSFANGSVWVRNGGQEIVAIDGSTGRASSPLPARAAGLGKQAKVLASTTGVLAVSTGDPERDQSLRFVRR